MQGNDLEFGRKAIYESLSPKNCNSVKRNTKTRTCSEKNHCTNRLQNSSCFEKLFYLFTPSAFSLCHDDCVTKAKRYPYAKWIVAFVLVLFLQTVEANSCASTCPLNCACSEGKHDYISLPLPVYCTVANCSNINRRPASSEYFNLLGWLYLENNNLTSFPDIQKQRQTLHELYLKNNSITELSYSDLYDLYDLEILDISHNKITEIKGEFMQRNGELKTYPAFIAMGSLLKLNLSNNRLSNIPTGVFQQLTKLKELDLSANNLKTLSHIPFNKIKSDFRWSMVLYDNPWRCDFLMKWVQRDDLPFNISDMAEVKCAEPPSTSLASVDFYALRCAQAHVSCINTSTPAFVVWEYMDKDRDHHTNQSCNSFCYINGYYYASVEENTCYCASAKTEQVILTYNETEWKECMKVCGDVNSRPIKTCGRNVLSGYVMRTSYQLQFSGIRTFSQNEEVSIKAKIFPKITQKLMWNWNDSSDREIIKINETVTARHKYAAPGVYRVTVSVLEKEDEGPVSYPQIFGLPIIIEMPINDFELTCPSDVSMDLSGDVEVKINTGTRIRIHWSDKSEGVQPPSTLQYFIKSRLYYLAYSGDKVSWSTAQNECQKNKGNLAFIYNQDVQEYITTQVIKSVGTSYWIGLIDKITEGTYMHYEYHGNDKKQYSITSTLYTNWATGQPDDIPHPQVETKPEEDCVYLDSTGKWHDGDCTKDLHAFICQYPPDAFLEEVDSDLIVQPNHFITGQAKFSKTISAFANISQEVLVAPNEHVYVALFPQSSMQENGIVNAWEFIDQHESTRLHLQIYRPHCNDEEYRHIIYPGCSQYPTNVAVCSKNACSTEYLNTECSNGFQWCSITGHCQAATDLCKSNTAPTFDHRTPSYELVKNYIVGTIGHTYALNQFVVYDDIDKVSVMKHDIIGVSFEIKSNISTTQNTNFPFLCEKSNNSIWQEDMTLYHVSSWVTQTEYLSAVLNKTINSVWCAVRLHYSQSGVTKIPVTTLIKHNENNLAKKVHTFKFSAMNDVFKMEEKTCSIKVIDEIRSISVANFAVKVRPQMRSLENEQSITDQINVPRKLSFPLKLNVTGGGEETIVTVTTSEGRTYNTTTEEVCDEQNNCQTQATANIMIIEEEEVITVEASTADSSRSMRVLARSVVPISGLTVLPGVERVLVGVPQTFNGNVSEGGGVSYKWQVDGLKQFQHEGNVFHIIFRLLGDYELTLTAENSLGPTNTTQMLNVDTINKFNSMSFQLPTFSVAQSGTEQMFKVKVKVDINIDVTIKWFYDGTLINETKYLEPHTIVTPYPTPEVEELEIEQLITLGSAKEGVEVEVRAESDYGDSITEPYEINVRDLISEVTVNALSEVGKDESIAFEITNHAAGSKYTYSWDDGSQSNDLDTKHTSHTYISTGIYNISVTADNEISQFTTYHKFTVYSRITEVNLACDPPHCNTEVDYATKIVATLPNGFVASSKPVEYLFKWNDDNTYEYSQANTAQFNYTTIGEKHVTVTAKNELGEKISDSIKITVFKVELIDVNQTTECTETGTEINVQAILPTQEYSLFTFNVFFEDDLQESSGANVNLFKHTYSSSGLYTGNLTVQSLQSGKSATKNFDICVQDGISSTTLLSNSPVVTGKPVTFTITISGGTNVTYDLAYYSGQIATNYDASVTSKEYTYITPGEYNASITAFNVVSRMRDNINVIVQDGITNVNMSHDSSFGQSVIAKSTPYLFNCSYATGTDPTCTWNFGDSTIVTGRQVSHSYSTMGSFVISLNVSNLVDSKETFLNITVKEPIVVTNLAQTVQYAQINTDVTFTVTYTPSSTSQVFWEVIPGYNRTIGTNIFNHTFKSVDNFTITVTVQNEVSEDTDSVYVLCAESIPYLMITSSDIIFNDYIAIGDSTFSVTLGDGQPISVTTAGSDSPLGYSWTLAQNNDVIGTSIDGPSTELTIPNYGVFTLHVNVTNGISSNQTSIELTAVVQITTLQLTKDEPQGAAAINEQFTIVSITDGSNYTCEWDGGLIATPYVGVNFTYTYASSSNYTITANCSNILGFKIETYSLSIQEQIYELQLHHNGSLTAWAVASDDPIMFNSSVSTGTEISYSWTITDNGRIVVQETSADTITYSFPNVGIYNVSLLVSNKINADETWRTIEVLQPVTGLKLEAARYIVPTSAIVQFTGSVDTGTDINFEFSIPNIGISLANPLIISQFTANHSYSFANAGTQKVEVIASNLISSEVASVNFTVRNMITGFMISWCCTEGDYLEANTTQSFSSGGLTSGMDADVTWVAQYDTTNDIAKQETVENFDVTFEEEGIVTLTATADNVISSEQKSIHFHIQHPVYVELSIVYIGRPFYTYDDVILEMTTGPVQSERVSHKINWDDGDTEQTNLTSATHEYNTNGTFNISVISKNQVSQVTNSILVDILKLECTSPQLSFVTTHRSFPRSTRFLFETKLTNNNCTTYTIKYMWTMYKQDDCNITNSSVVQTFLMYDNKPRIIVPALSLDVRKYCFEVEVKYEDTYLSDMISTVVEIVSSNPVAIINGGSLRLVQMNDYILNGELSFDPDVLFSQQVQLNALWTCYYEDFVDNGITNIQIQKNFTHICPFNPPPVEKYTIPASVIESNKEYQFNLTVTKPGNLQESTSQNVIFLSRVVPEVSILCQTCILHSSIEITATKHIVLEGSYIFENAVNNVDYSWHVTMTSKTGASQSLTNDAYTTTGFLKKNLVIREGVIQPDFEYKFNLIVTIDDSDKGLSELILYPNNPPNKSLCIITPSSGQINVLEEMIFFQCTGWIDDDEPLVYSVIASRNNTETTKDIFLLYRGSSASYETYLPLGKQSDGYNVEITIMVEDQYGATKVGLKKDLEVVLVVPPSQNILSYMYEKVNGELSGLQRQNDPQEISCFATSLATTLNQQSVEAQSTLLKDDILNGNKYSDRKTLREDITWVVIDLEASSLEEVEQLASVIGECIKIESEVQDPSLINATMNKVESMIEVIQQDSLSTGQGTIESIGNNLIAIISRLIDAVNYPINEPENSLAISKLFGITYDDQTRQDNIIKLLEYVDVIVATMMKGKVQGEEPLTTITDTMSLWYQRNTPSTMSRTIANDGCTFEIPQLLFCDLDPDETLFMSMYTFEKNVYTFGEPTLLGTPNQSVTSRVTSLQFTTANDTEISVTNIDASACPNTVLTDAGNGYCASNMFRLTMAQSGLNFLTEEQTFELSNLEGPYYDATVGLNFTSLYLESKQSAAIEIDNKNSDPKTAMYIMVTYKKDVENSYSERNPVVLVLFSTQNGTDLDNYDEKMELTDAIVKGDNHLEYTLYLDPQIFNTTLPYYFLNVTNNFEYHNANVSIAVFYSSCQFLDEKISQWSPNGIYTSPDSTVSLAVCCASHLTSFGSFTISPPNIISITSITNIDFRKSVVALVTVIIILLVYIFAMIWSRKLDIRDIKNSSLIPLCGPNGSFKYEITIKTSAGMGSGTTANVGVCLYGYDAMSRSRHIYKKNAFQRGNVDSFQIASDVDLGQIYKIKIWHDNTGLDPAWCVERIYVKDLQNNDKYYFLVDAWMQVYPDDDDEDCLQKTVEVATEEDLNDFTHVFGTQLAYGWEDAHLWLSVFEKPPQSRFTRVQRVTCCAVLVFTFLLFSAFWYQGYDPDGEITEGENKIGVLRWKDLAVGAIVALMVFPINMIIIIIFKKSKSHVSPVKPWPERTQTAQTIEILDEVIDGRGKRHRQSSRQENLSALGEYFNSKNHLPGQNEFLAELNMESSESVLFSRGSVADNASRTTKYSNSTAAKSTLHKTSGTVKSLDFKDKGPAWGSEDSAIQMSESPTSSDSYPSEGSNEVLLKKSNSVGISRPKVGEAWVSSAKTKQTEPRFDNVDKKVDAIRLQSRQSIRSAKAKKATLRRRNTAYVRRDIDSATPPNVNQDALEEGDNFWDIFPDDNETDSSFMNCSSSSSKQTNLKRTRVSKFDETELPYYDNEESLDFNEEFASDDDLYEDLDDVPLPEMPPTRDGVNFQTRASSIIGTSPQPSQEQYLLPHWCIYANYVVCFIVIAICSFYIILYGNAFGPNTTLRWLLCTLIAVLESFFLIEPVKVILFAVFLAMVTKPMNPDENDNLVEEPFVEAYEHVKSTRVRPLAGFALQQCKDQAKKSQRMEKVFLNLSLYLLLLSSVAAVASWDKSSHAIYMSKSTNEAFFRQQFVTSKLDISLNPNNRTFYSIRSAYEIRDWLQNVIAVKIFDSNSQSLDNENINNVLFGSIRLRQQRTEFVTCPLNNGIARNPGGLVDAQHNCLTTDQSKQVTSDLFPKFGDNATFLPYLSSQLQGVMYWGENHMYNDGGYSDYIANNSTAVEMQKHVNQLFNNNWIDRQTSVVFVEFTLYNPANLWFVVVVAMFEIGVTGAVRPSADVNIVRMFVPSSALYVDMIFMPIVGIIILLLLAKELKKIGNKKITASLYFQKYTNWLNLIVILLGVALCVLYVYKEVYMEEVMQSYIANKQAFTNFYKIAFYTDLVTYVASILLAVIMIRAVRIFRFIRWWSVFGTTLYNAALHLFYASIMMITLILTYAMLGYLIYGQSYTNIVVDFQDFPNAIYAMFRAFRGRLTFNEMYDASPAFTTIFFLSFYIGVFFVVGSLFAAILIDQYKYARIEMKQPMYSFPDYETLDYFITRVKLRLGIIKPKQFRPTVHFEDMSRPSSRGSFQSLDSFDTCFNPGRISQFSNASGFSSSSSDSGLGTPSDHSISIFDYLQREPPSDRPLDPLHLEHLYDRLSTYSVDMMLKRFERVNELGEEVLGLESNLLALTDHIKQKKKMQEQSQEIAMAASSTTVRPKFSPGSRYSDDGISHTVSSMQSQTHLSTASLKSRSKSVLSGDSMLQTVLNSMFPGDESSSEQPQQPPYRSGSYAGSPSAGNESSENAFDDVVLESAQSSRSTNSDRVNKKEKTKKQWPHSDEGKRITTTSLIEQSQNDRKSLLSMNKTKPKTKPKPKSNLNPLTKRNAWLF